MDILVDYMFSGFLVGLGFGFLGSGLLPLISKSQMGDGYASGENRRDDASGAFLILIGIGIVYEPAALWPYAIAGFLVLLGIWLLVRGFHHIS